MGILAGTRLGPYEITAPLGAGGMGEVYRARDTKLNRDVALKVLPEAFASDPERMARFEREAQVLASLNHPNIAAIYGLEESGSVRALVMELVEGETLAEKIVAARPLTHPAPRDTLSPQAGRGQKAEDLQPSPLRGRGWPAGPGEGLPLDESLHVARQIAEALEAAHEKGIVHRDLKPANIKINPEGAVKVLDFGLAKALEEPAASSDPSNSPTLSGAATRAGVIMGTAAYMSPEQARGHTVDRRSDIWSFGVVLYEMLTGQQAFQGESTSDILASVLKFDPDWNALQASVPPSIIRLLHRCLTKDRKQRLQAIGEARIAIEETLSSVGAGLQNRPHEESAPGTMRTSPLQRALPWAIVAVLVVVVLGLLALVRGSGLGPLPTYHQLTFDRGLIYAARFAPDGDSIYYSAAWNGQPIQVYTTKPNGPESRALGLTDSGLFAVSSSELAISQGCNDLMIGDCEGTLAEVPVSGGAPRAVAKNVVSADWGPDGSNLAAIRQNAGRFQVEFPLGKVVYQSASWLNFLRVSPRGDAVAFAAFDEAEADAGHILIVDRGAKQIARSESFVSVEGLAWTPAGNEVWFGAARDSGWANAIHALALSGRERTVLRVPGMLRLHDVSRDGRLLISQEIWRDETRFRVPNDPKDRDLSWLDSSDVTDISGNGQNIAFFGWGEASTLSFVYMRRTDGSPPVRLGQGEISVFSPDGQWILSNVPVSPTHLVLLPTGAGEPRELAPNGIRQFSTLGWMPDGREVYFAGNDGKDWKLYVESVSGGKIRAFTPAISLPVEMIEAGLVSPDGRWAFARDMEGKAWLYPLAGGNPRPALGVVPGDIWINWSNDGRFAYVYRNDVTRAPVFRIDLQTGKRQALTELAPSDPAGLTAINPVRITSDAKFFAYSYDRALSNLFLVGGVK